MDCFSPLTAWRSRNTNPDGKRAVTIGKQHQRNADWMQVPCGQCFGCDQAQAQAWALRCKYEMHSHELAAFATLTYAEEHVPITLQKRHLQAFLKRLRTAYLAQLPPARRQDMAANRIRFFASGEYGDQFGRPHYHAILYGLSESHDWLVADAWNTGRPHRRSLGFTTLTDVTDARIAYVAGYVDKKIGWRHLRKEERIDNETGEVYTWQPPFIQMSRRPGIGDQARQHLESWRLYAINQGHKQPVPRYFHEAWKGKATKEEIEELYREKEKFRALRGTKTQEQLEAAFKIALAKHAIRKDKRQH